MWLHPVVFGSMGGLLSLCARRAAPTPKENDTEENAQQPPPTALPPRPPRPERPPPRPEEGTITPVHLVELPPPGDMVPSDETLPLDQMELLIIL